MDKSTGDLSQGPDGASYPSKLMMTSVDYVDDKYCSISVKQKEDKFCAGIMEGGKDSCTGDSGGIIFLKKGKKVCTNNCLPMISLYFCFNELMFTVFLFKQIFTVLFCFTEYVLLNCVAAH